MVAAVAAKIGMKCRLVQESWVPHEDAVYDRVGNILLSRVMVLTSKWRMKVRHRHRQSWEQAIADVKAKGGKPYAIPAGASVHKYGGLVMSARRRGARAGKELGFAFDYIVVCSVTGSPSGMLSASPKTARAQGDRHRRLFRAGQTQSGRCLRSLRTRQRG